MSEATPSLKIAIPKGSLQEPTINLLRKAGYNIYVSSRGYRPASDDPELDLFLIRAQEIGRYIAQGFIDCGITGRDSPLTDNILSPSQEFPARNTTYMFTAAMAKIMLTSESQVSGPSINLPGCRMESG